ncbi:hypothetical protein A9Q84_20285 [Halobacteriovorax marinus]|uniref:Flagellar biosynthesis protein FlgH n=1 Tax=Halobacteriovorax marinus TaxID=97084 RepID=A0A1Y5F143_9BACT|nr:hypothetical protein A9Q84_20285 [Halobacteriovorax marinus]
MKAIKLLLIFLLPLLFSCSNYINKMYRDLDKDQGRKSPARQDQFNRYRNPQLNPQGHTRVGSKPLNYQRNAYMNSQNRNRLPQTRRSYRPQQQVKKRYTSNDLLDTGRNTSSLWAGKGKGKHLFTEQEEKKHGDIILINVQKALKNDMTLELKRAFPTMARAKKKDNKEADKKDDKAKEDVAKKETGTTDKVYDRVSSVVIEEINQDHLLIRGQKSVLFKNRKRLVEIQALISRRDITDEDTVNSDNILETSVHVLR